MKKHILKLGLFVTAIVTLTGCGYTVEEQSEHKKIEAFGSDRCVRYIDTKYGFEPEIVSTDIVKDSSSNSFSPDATGELICTCKKNEDTFYVYIPNINDTNKTISDTYQESDVSKAVTKEVSKYFNIDDQNIYVKVEYNSLDDKYNYLSEYFESLDIFDNIEYNVYIGLVNTDISKINKDFKDKLHFNEAQITVFDNDIDADKWYDDPAYIVKNNTTHLLGCVTFTNKYQDGGYVSEILSETYKYSTCNNVTFNCNGIKVTEIEPYVDSNRLADEGYLDPKYATDFYLIDNSTVTDDVTVVQISVKLSDIGITAGDSNVYSFVGFHESNGYNEIQPIFTKIVDDELIGSMYIYGDNTKQSFAVIKESKNSYYDNK